MPKPKLHTTEELVTRAMYRFWQFGYELTSMSELVQTTGVSRHGIYAAFGGKKELFLACLERYQDLIVSPAFEQVEEDGANLESVGNYFHLQIKRAEQAGLPGPGCLVANTMTECGPHDQQIEAAVAKHNQRLYAGFLNALGNEFGFATNANSKRLANFLMISAQGLWSASRTVNQPKELKDYANTLIDMVSMRVRP